MGWEFEEAGRFDSEKAADDYPMSASPAKATGSNSASADHRIPDARDMRSPPPEGHSKRLARIASSSVCVQFTMPDPPAV